MQWSGPEPVAGWRFWTCCQFLKFTVCLPACLIYNGHFYSPCFHILHVRLFIFLSIVSPTCFIPSVWPAGGLRCFNGPLNEVLPLRLHAQTETEDVTVPYMCVCCVLKADMCVCVCYVNADVCVNQTFPRRLKWLWTWKQCFLVVQLFKRHFTAKNRVWQINAPVKFVLQIIDVFFQSS